MAVDPGLATCFAAVAEAKSFTQAAVRLGLTQPQVSLRIAKLEHQLGFPLLARTTRQVELTQLGKSFLPYAEDIARACEAAKTFAMSLESRQANVFRVGSPEVSLAQHVRRELIIGFMDRYPRIQLDTCIMNLRVLWDKLISGELDAVLSYKVVVNSRRPPIPHGCDEVPLLHTIGHICVPKESPLAKLKVLRPEDLTGQSMVISPGKDCPNVIEDLEAALRRMGVSISLAPETHRSTLEYMARARRLLSFQWCEPGVAPPPAPADMVVLPLENDLFVLELSIMTQRGSRSMLARRFVEMAKEVAARHVQKEFEPVAQAS